MKRKMADLDVLMDETLTLCKTPPVPRRHPYREFYQYRKPSLPQTPSDTTTPDLSGPPMFEFGSQTDLVPKPLFSRSNSLPSRAQRPSRPPEPFQFTADIVKSPSPLFSRRNTLPSRVRRAAAADRKPSPLSRREDAQPPEPTHLASSVMATTPKRPSPLSGKGSVRRPGPPTHAAPFQPASPMVLSPVTSHASSVTSSPTPSLFSDSASFSASAPSTPSTPATSPPSSPANRARSPMCYFTPAYWTIATSPSPVYIPRQKLRRKDSPKYDTLRTLRAKESDACLERIYDQRTSAYMDWTGFTALTN
ncbi:uncharacterized protein SETTUDRAFT_171831 [Exserohilum turcica Et28A]|uniref:Uncharacterized protein n=1 Tax=Exserohilum turcicum (strain 28A) TaxID=671987 RepID=R0IHX2_EXST2|nr:uncharacterized protein SETTUDRAFT_171831 [Exserohilum turcica Et28A]EOA84785.1 hypothetical protein SETTUDRAFT_171831 [Exserohilum turcica Et28A]